MSKPVYDAENGILYQKTSGFIDFARMSAGSEKLIAVIRERKQLKILEDAREAVAGFSVMELHTLLNNFEKNLDESFSVKHAVIHSDPTATAYAILAHTLMTSARYQISVFSTEETARAWLEI